VSRRAGAPNRDDPALERSLRRWQRSGVFVAFLLLLAFPVYLGVEAGHRTESLAAREAALINMGRELWAVNCASCHGLEGQGVDAPALNSKEFFEAISDEQIHHLTASGIPGTEMPAWWNELGGPLTDEQIRALVAFIRSWEPSAPSRPDWRAPEGSPGSEDQGD
jgi:mono/diheme cytochrome c family protein